MNYYGSVSSFTWDDEDRLTGVTGANGLSDAFAYNGLRQRVAKTDSTGQYALVSDGASPAAPVLADGLTVYTPGLSARRGGASTFRHGDLLGSLRFETDANQTVVANRLYSGFGAALASSGDPWMPFGWVGDGASQTDADTGLVLLGHRVYDSRLGRFLSQDPAGAGGNWYAYCGNNPINGADPSGLSANNAFSAPSAQGEGPNGAFNGQLGGFMGGGEGLDAFFANENEATQRGQAGYLTAEAARQARPVRYYHQRLNTPGTVWNNSSSSIPIMFDHDTKNGKVFYEMMLPPHSYTGLEDIDFVYSANDPQAPGGYDWRHIHGDTNTRIWDAAGGQINISGWFVDATFKGYPYGVRPWPVSGNTSIDIFTIPQPGIPPLLIGAIP